MRSFSGESYSVGQAGIAIACYGTGGVLAGAVGGYLADRIGRRNTIMIATLGEMICLPVSSAYVARIAPDKMRGRYMGAMAFAWTGATVVGPWFGMQLYTINPALVWVSCGLLGLAAATLLIFVTGRAPEEETDAIGAVEPHGERAA